MEEAARVRRPTDLSSAEIIELLLNELTVEQIIDLFRMEDRLEELNVFEYRSAKLTRNGSGSLILTCPNSIWKDAGVDHENPGSVSIYYSSEEKKAVMDLG